MEEEKDSKTTVVESNDFNTRKKDEHVKKQLESMFEMEARKDQLRSEIDIKSAMLRSEQHKRSELESHLSKNCFT